MKTYPWYRESPQELQRNPRIKGMTPAQFGGFMRIRFSMWENAEKPGALPFDLEMLRCIAGMSPDEWHSEGGAIIGAFLQDDSATMISSPDLMEWYEHASEKSGKRSTAGKAGGRPKNEDLIPRKFSPEVVSVIHYYRNEVYEAFKGHDDSLFEACCIVTQILKEGEYTAETLKGTIDRYAEELGGHDEPMPFKAANFFKKRVYEMYRA